MADLITTAQFTARTGRTLTAAETTQVEALIDDASALVADIVNDTAITGTWDATVAGSVPSSVIPVVVAMVRRGLENPNGYTSESVGTYSYSGGAGVGLWATREEARTIRKAVGTSAVGSLNLSSHLNYRVSWLDGAL